MLAKNTRKLGCIVLERRFQKYCVVKYSQNTMGIFTKLNYWSDTDLKAEKLQSKLRLDEQDCDFCGYRPLLVVMEQFVLPSSIEKISSNPSYFLPFRSVSYFLSGETPRNPGRHLKGS